MFDFYKENNRGFTLVELMVSLTLGAILILGIFQLLINTNTVSRSTRAGNDIQEAGRFSMEFLVSDLSLAGSTRIDTDLTNNADPTTRLSSDITLGEAVDPIVFDSARGSIGVRYVNDETPSTVQIPLYTVNNPVSGSGSNARSQMSGSNRRTVLGDVLVVQYYPPNQLGCDGQTYSSGDSVTNVYWARGDGQPGGGNTAEGGIDTGIIDGLYCFSYKSDTPPTGTVEVSPLVIGVEGMEVDFYSTTTTQFESAATTLSGRNIRKIRVAMLVHSRSSLNRELGATPTTRTFNVLGEQYEIVPTGAADMGARLFRQVYSSSASLLNAPAFE